MTRGEDENEETDNQDKVVGEMSILLLQWWPEDSIKNEQEEDNN